MVENREERIREMEELGYEIIRINEDVPFQRDIDEMWKYMTAQRLDIPVIIILEKGAVLPMELFRYEKIVEVITIGEKNYHEVLMSALKEVSRYDEVKDKYKKYYEKNEDYDRFYPNKEERM